VSGVLSARFDGYGVLVTGAGQGMGAAIARRFAAEGGQVVVTDRDGDKAESTAKAVRDAGGAAFALACDVSDSASVEAAVAESVERLGCLDVLVNNAASAGAGSDLAALSDEGWARDLDVTLTGAFRCLRAAMPHLIASGHGAVVNIGSVNGEMSFGDHAYSAAKAGLASLTRTAAAEYASRGVRVNLVAPGTTRTPNWDANGGETFLGKVAAHYPLGRVGVPDDVAAACAFLASRDASWITGVTLPVDGGVLIQNVAMGQLFRELRS
jgi:meso-butanediol dehydrogenase / (S,S)-butanediol dehydrogenase / diacetyl reductase